MSDLRPLTIRKTWAFYGKTDYNDMTCRNSNNHKKMKIHLFKRTVLKRGCHWGARSSKASQHKFTIAEFNFPL